MVVLLLVTRHQTFDTKYTLISCIHGIIFDDGILIQFQWTHECLLGLVSKSGTVFCRLFGKNCRLLEHNIDTSWMQGSRSIVMLICCSRTLVPKMCMYINFTWAIWNINNIVCDKWHLTHKLCGVSVSSMFHFLLLEFLAWHTAWNSWNCVKVATNKVVTKSWNMVQNGFPHGMRRSPLPVHGFYFGNRAIRLTFK